MLSVRLLTSLSARTWRRTFADRTKEFLKGPKLPPPAPVLRSFIPPPPSLSPASSGSPSCPPSSSQFLPTPQIIFRQEHNTVRKQVFALFNLAKYIAKTGTSSGPVTSSQDFEKLMTQLIASAPELSSKQWTQCLWALSRLQVKKHKLTSLVFAEIIRDPYRLEVEGLTLVAFAARELEAPQQLWDALTSAIMRCDSLPRRAISFFLFAFADAGKQDRALFDHLCRLELQATETPTVEDLSHVVNALGRPGYGDSALLQRAAMQLVERIHEVSSNFLATIVRGIVSYAREHNPQAVSIYEPLLDAMASRVTSHPSVELNVIRDISQYLKRDSVTEKLWVAVTQRLAQSELTTVNMHLYFESLRLLYVINREVPSAEQLDRINSFLTKSTASVSAFNLRHVMKVITELKKLRLQQVYPAGVEPPPHLIDFLDVNMFSKCSEIEPEILLAVTQRLPTLYSNKSPSWKPLQYRFSQMLSSLLVSFQKSKGESTSRRVSLLSKCLWQQCVWDVYDPQLIQFCLNELESMSTELHAEACAQLFLLQTSLSLRPACHVTYPPALDLLGKVAFSNLELSLKPPATVIAKVVESLPAGVNQFPSSSTLNRLPYAPHLLVQYNGKAVAVEIVKRGFFDVFAVRRSQLERSGYGYVSLTPPGDVHCDNNTLQEILRTRLQQAVPSAAEASSSVPVLS
eukprot:GILJ01006523.1.p1 GENE.GILJ01006523.1~~GILJ01006523.1.p1  ORF type:complete len:687 (-),score=102.58 GILJ01006523.1:140-2200(-)